MTLEQIINAFINYTSEVNGRYGLSIRGGALYSYNLKIAEHGREWGDLQSGIYPPTP